MIDVPVEHNEQPVKSPIRPALEAVAAVFQTKECFCNNFNRLELLVELSDLLFAAARQPMLQLGRLVVVFEAFDVYFKSLIATVSAKINLSRKLNLVIRVAETGQNSFSRTRRLTGMNFFVLDTVFFNARAHR